MGILVTNLAGAVWTDASVFGAVPTQVGGHIYEGCYVPGKLGSLLVGTR